MPSQSKILVVDDQKAILTFLSAILSVITPVPIVHTFCSPIKALAALTEEQFDLILLDYTNGNYYDLAFSMKSLSHPNSIASFLN